MFNRIADEDTNHSGLLATVRTINKQREKYSKSGMASFHGRGAHASAAKKRDASRKSDISLKGSRNISVRTMGKERWLRSDNRIVAAYHGPWIASGTPPCLPLRGHLAPATRAPTSGRIHPPFFTPVIYALYDYATFPSFSKRITATANRVSQSRLNAVPITNLAPL